MRDEPERAKLRMNANPHDEPGTNQFEGDGRTAFGQREDKLGSQRHGGEIRDDSSGIEGARVSQTKQAGARHRASVSGEGNGDQSRATDPANRAVEHGAENRTQTSPTAHLSRALSAGGYCAVR